MEKFIKPRLLTPSGQSHKKFWQAAGLCALTAAIFFLPFYLLDGGFFHYAGDFNSQQISFYRYMNGFVKGAGYPDSAFAGAPRNTFSWATDLGSGVMNAYSFYLYGSPFFWLSVLLPQSWLPYMMVPLLVLKFGVAGGMNYRPLDIFVHMREVLDDEHAIVVVNPPTYFSGYERYYDTGGLMTWKEPEYELFDPDSGHGKLFEMIADAKALVLCYQEKPAGEYIGEAIFARGETRKGMNAYVCSNRGDEAEALAHGKKIKRPSDSALEPLPCAIMPTDHEITEASDLKIIKVKAANTQYYRKIWTHNFVGSSATFNFAVLIDKMVAGVFGISKVQADSLFIWYVMKVPHQQYRLGRLLYMLAQNRHFCETIVNDFDKERLVSVRTAMLTKHPENKEVRGIMKLVDRKKDKTNGYKLTYEAPVIDGRTEAETLKEWLRREKEWQTKRNATK